MSGETGEKRTIKSVSVLFFFLKIEFGLTAFTESSPKGLPSVNFRADCVQSNPCSDTVKVFL